MKKRVTEKSLRVGQTVYYVGNTFRDGFNIKKIPVEKKQDIIYWYFDLDTNLPYNLFYSKKKAKTKMNKLNKEIG
ncbi:MAG: hypothetical protein GY928_22155 [Colwellia sp.]|nr:hypothetical protein [Colwellia sp.]